MTDRSPALQRAIDAAQERHRGIWNAEVTRREQEVIDGVIGEAEVLTRADAAVQRGRNREGR